MKDSFTKTKWSTFGAWARIMAGLILCIAVVTATVIGCGWPGTTSHSVRFNDYQTEREMGRLPPLPTLAHGLNDGRVHWEQEEEASRQDPDDDYALGEKRTQEVNALWERGEVAETESNLRLARDLIRAYLERTSTARDPWFSRSGDRNSAIDRLDALSALDRGAQPEKVKAYLDARRGYDSGKSLSAEADAIDLAASDPNLKDNVAYLRSAELQRAKNFTEAAAAFGALARQYPRSEKRDAALFMVAVATMKTSALYIPGSGNSDYKVDDATSAVEPDQAWHDAFAGFQKAIKEYPSGRYFNEARGWLAYLWLRRHDRAAALVEYYRLLAEKNEDARVEAAFSLMLIRSSATEDEMSRVEKQLANEPEAALAYAYHNIYNYSIDPGEPNPPYDPNEEPIKDSLGNEDYEAGWRRDAERNKEWAQGRAATTRKELIRTLNFSKQLMARYPRLSPGGAFALRAAQASEELDDNEAAASLAGRALQNRLSGADRAQALWTLGVAQYRLRRFVDARKSLTTLVRDYPNDRLIEGARRQLAMIAEDAGDVDGALEHYIALDYDLDVSYFVDRLMTPEQLAGFIEKHPDSPRRNEFTYALGLRYLRANRWEEARKALGRVRPARAPDYNPYYLSDNCEGGATINCTDPKDGDRDENDDLIITPRLLLRDIQSANDLEALERRANVAQGDEAKAEALYQLASYQYEASSLLFYNPLASPGYWNLSELAREGRYRAANEAQLLFESTQEHERLARALTVYLDVVDRFPQTRAARDSLYTAAVCHDRLSSYNPYWREIYENGLHAGERMVTYNDVKAAYPDYQLPRGTYGWQPSTRTVNGGPGWQAPPKPPPPRPRLTRGQRLKKLSETLVTRLLAFWNENGRRWLTEFVMMVGLFFAVRVASRNRKRLRARLARQRLAQSRQVVTYPWLKLFWIDHVEPSRREQVGKFIGEKRQEFLELAKDRRSRPVLLRSLVSHTVLSGLVLALLWTAW